jgi:CubicO group peptidase (beta-lactamase class C family)
MPLSLILPISKCISRKSVTSLLGILTVCLVLPLNADSVDDYVRSELARQRIPGLAVVVTRSGKVVKVAGYGYANLEHQVPVKPETVFQSGSISKQLAASVAMLLVEDGKIVLDEPVKKYLPDAPPAWDSITVRHLLTHTSGIPEYEYGKDFDRRKDYTDDERLGIVYGMKLEFAPGSRWNYSDTGYMVLGILLSRAGGDFYGDILKRRVFEPLGMKTARIISEEDLVPNRAAGYRLLKDEIKNQKFISPSNYKTADGSLCWSVLDMAKWADAARTKALLKPDSWREMTTAVRLSSGKTYPYGFGWFIDEWGGKQVLAHGGFGSGFTAQLSRRLGDDELAVAVLCNRVGIRLGKMARDIMAIYEPELALNEKPIEDKEPGTTAQVRDFLARAAAGKLVESDFAFLSGGFNEKRMHDFADLLAPLGELRSLTLLKRREQGDDVERLYLGQFVKATADIWIQFTVDHKVSDFSVEPR